VVAGAEESGGAGGRWRHVGGHRDPAGRGVGVPRGPCGGLADAHLSPAVGAPRLHSEARWPAPSPRRVSQDPRLVCHRAPFPLTPGSPVRARTRDFRTGRRLQPLWQRGHYHWFHEAESDSPTLGSRRRSPRPSSVRRPAAAPPDRSVSRRQLPFDAGPELHVERAIHTADTSQSARRIWVTLAHPEERSQRRRTESFGWLNANVRCSRRTTRDRGASPSDRPKPARSLRSPPFLRSSVVNPVTSVSSVSLTPATFPARCPTPLRSLCGGCCRASPS
jgi:hypothetical protein